MVKGINETSMSKTEYEQNVQTLANLEAIRVNQFQPFNIFEFRDGNVTANNVTSQRVQFPVFEPGYIYVITSICAHDPDDAAHQIHIGILDGVTPCVYQSATVANADDSVEYVGQLMCKETDKIYADFLAVGATDGLYVSMNGYRIRR
ncbi:MAG TPA: hypothetical protein VMV32_12370 [Ignavibacteriaceae bacterium]|nr:hypothetical protein [Ignavibacteriaceae bacterium]